MASKIQASGATAWGHAGLLQQSPSRKFFPLKGSASLKEKTLPSAFRVKCMKTWNPINNKKFEVLSYLPPLSEDSIAKEIDYMMSKGWIPCLEFAEVPDIHRTNSRIPGYYDGRYWTMWKLPMFGCTDSGLVLGEVEECKKTYANAYIRLLAFDNKRQCQCMSFVIQKPASK